MARKKLFIVGNGVLLEDMSERVDACDAVMRFNEPKASIGMSGTKTTWLFVCNTGKPMKRRLDNPDYPTSPIVQAAGLVILAFHPISIEKYAPKVSLWAQMKGRRTEWTWASINLFGGAGKMVAILPVTDYEAGCRELGLEPSTLVERRTYPSTGYFGIRYALEQCPADQWDVEIAGFSWQGWQKHAWADERSWLERKVAERNIHVWPAGDDQKPKYKRKQAAKD
ncbi:glycosyltransferase family 29 protein [Mesorhizobium yinganensis]|uniref:glycosyltransferase family 29 protein n=1 Tax=Mesorhizobium yinganensis TaxID=3157707 RepID=UPI0032B78AFC